MPIPESELIISPEGKIYHLNLCPEMIAQTIIVVGDPERVPKISCYFDKIHFQVNSRELVTHTGELAGQEISVVSSGMGIDNVELLITELDALVNVDFETREVKDKPTSLDIYRIGTSGCLQEDIPIDAYLASKGAIGLDSLMEFYNRNSEYEDFENQLKSEFRFNFKPYVSKPSERLLAKFEGSFYQGVTVTSPGFYAPQGRAVRLELSNPSMVDQLTVMDTPLGRITNFEMETAAYYALCSMLGHDMISLNTLTANRARKEFSANHEAAVEGLIKTVLERIV